MRGSHPDQRGFVSNSGTNKTKGENTQNKGENEALCSRLSPFPTPGCHRKSREALPPLALGFLMFSWQQSRGFAVLSSLQSRPDPFPEDLRIFDHYKQSYILIDFFFSPSSKVAVVQWVQILRGGSSSLFKFSGRIKNRISLVLSQLLKHFFRALFFTQHLSGAFKNSLSVSGILASQSIQSPK